MFKYFLHYDKTTGKLVGYDKATEFVIVDDFKTLRNTSTTEVTKEEFEQATMKKEK